MIYIYYYYVVHAHYIQYFCKYNIKWLGIAIIINYYETDLLNPSQFMLN